jgi:hypothetical protein
MHAMLSNVATVVDLLRPLPQKSGVLAGFLIVFE